MARPFAVSFDKAHTTQVTFAVEPRDSVTGAIVTGGLQATVKGLRVKPIRSLSGRLVFVELPTPATYTVSVEPNGAPFFPESVDVHVPDREIRPEERLPPPKAVFHLIPMRGYVFAETATLIRGSLRRSATGEQDLVPMPNMTVTAHPIGPVDGAFRSHTGRTDDSGEFVLFLNLAGLARPPADQPPGPQPALASLIEQPNGAAADTDAAPPRPPRLKQRMGLRFHGAEETRETKPGDAVDVVEGRTTNGGRVLWEDLDVINA